MPIQIGLKFGMFVDVFVLFDDGGILAEVPRDVRVMPQKLAELAVSRVRVAALRFGAVKSVFLSHEGVGIFLHLRADTLVVLKVGLQSRMILQELLVIEQRR